MKYNERSWWRKRVYSGGHSAELCPGVKRTGSSGRGRLSAVAAQRFAAAAFVLGMSACVQGGSAATTGSSGSGGGGAAGQVASGGTTGTAGSASHACTAGAACGGDALGKWTVSSSCLSVSGQLDLSVVGTGPDCKSTAVTGTLQITGDVIFNGDGSYTDETVTSGTEQFSLGPACLSISSTPVTCSGAANLLSVLGYSSLTCTQAGNGCNCAGTVQQTGGLAVVSVSPMTSGTYTNQNATLSLSSYPSDAKYSYCRSDKQLTLTAQGPSPTTGTITFEQSDVPSGTGGAPGTGGAATGGVGQGGTSTAGAGGATGAAGSGGAAGSSQLPCDIYQAAGNPCVAAHSTVRALFGAYSGKLYQVRTAAGATMDIPTLAPGGIADAAAQDTFCGGTTCVITVVYDQSGKGNDLWYQGSTNVPASTQSSPSKATSEAISIGGHKAYSLYINPGNSYWVDGSKSGIPTGSQPEGMYMVTSGKHFNSGCCFDYGNSETDRKADGAGAMDALNFSTTTAWGSGAGSGPWVMADLEYGLFSQGSNSKNPNDPAQTSAFVTAMLKNNGTTEYALRGSDATKDALTTYYKGALPGGWSPMKKQGAIVLGSGGDCCKPGGGANLSDGTFYEGCLVTGYPTDATESAVQANIAAVGYGK